jgi:hypothetical protein
MTTASVGDVDGNGTLDIAVGSNEVLGAEKAKNEGRGYILHADGNKHPGGPFFAGYPVATYGILAYVLPVVGSGVPGTPAMADLDYDGKLEVNFDTIGASGTFFNWEGKVYCPGKAAGKCKATFNNITFGAKSDSQDSPSYVLIASGSLGRIDPTGGIDFVKSGAGFNIAMTFASGGKRANFDHHVSAWDTQTGKMLEGWPRVIDDWQFFANPAIVDLDGDKKPEVVASSAGYLLHAWNYLGEMPKGFPKMTMGWILSSPALGDMDGDGNWDVAAGTRDGWLFAWKAGGKKQGALSEWPQHGHDMHNTSNYHAPINPYAKEPAQPDAGTTDAGSGDTASVDASSPPTKTTATPPAAKEDDGCNAGRSGHGSSALVLLGLIAAVVLQRRRRLA